jgi:small conductance mechanosensitive channel
LRNLAIILRLALIGAFVSLSPAPAWAHDAPQPAEDETPLTLPQELVRPSIPTSELALLLLPLTEPELGQLAADWQKLVRGKTEQVARATVAVKQEGGETGDLFRDKVAKAMLDRNALFERFTLVLDDWEKKGGDPEQIRKYRAYKNSIIIEEIRSTDLQTLLKRVQSWVVAPDGGIWVAIRLALIGVSLVAVFLLARMVRGAMRRWVGRLPRMSSLLQGFVIVTVYWLTVAFGLMFTLSLMGVDVTPLFALVGGASFILAFAMQETLGSLFAGLMIIANRPFDVGDYVDLEGVAAGEVKSMNIVSTTVISPDNKVIVVPNSRVWGSVITNVTASATRRVDLIFGIGYGDSIDKALAILMEVAKAHPLTLEAPEPMVRVGELGESSVNLLCRPWAKTTDYWTVWWDLTRQVKERFDAEGISIPFPQRDVHLHQVRAPGEAGAA